MELRVLKIPLGDVDAVIGTTARIRGPTWTLGIKKGIDTFSPRTKSMKSLKHV